MRSPLRCCFFALSAFQVFALPMPSPETHRETMIEAAINIKRLVHEVSTGTLASVFPDSGNNAGRPFALMEYHAPCFEPPSLAMLLFPISLSTKNILSTPSHDASYTVQMPMDGIYSPMSRGRVAFIGNITNLPFDDIPKPELAQLEKCYTSYHPDAKYWLPYQEHSRHPFDSMWAKFTPDDIYYVGGFGDTHYIGHVPVDVYTAAGEEEAKESAEQNMVLQS